MRLFKEEEKVQRAKFYPRIIPLANFLTNVSLIIYFANQFFPELMHVSNAMRPLQMGSTTENA